MFYGTHEHTIDDKNRLTLPAKFRDGLGGDIVLVRGIDGTIDVYPRKSWESSVERITALDSLTREAREMKRFVFSGAAVTDVDKQGRVLVPPDLASHAGAREGRRRRRRPRPHRDLGSPAVGDPRQRDRRERRRCCRTCMQTDAADHVPVLADEVRELLDVQPGETVVDATFGAGGHSRCSRRTSRAAGKLVAIDRDPTVRPYFDRFKAGARGVQTRFLRGDYGVVLSQLAANDVRPTRSCSTSALSSMQVDRPERGFSYATDAPLDMRMDPSDEPSAAERRDDVRRARARDDLPPLRRGAVRAPDRARHRAPA